MTHVAFLTISGVFQGDLVLESPVGQPVRFLDALNHPHRLNQIGGRAVPRLELADSIRREIGGRSFPCGPLIGLSSMEILAAYEVALERDEDRETKRVRSYEERHTGGEPETVALVLANGFRLTGEVAGGLNVLDLAKEGRHFIPVREVRLLAPGSDTALELDLVAVNALRLEASGHGEAW